MKPFLLLSSRGEDAVAEEEYASYCRLTGLLPEELDWIRLDQRPLSESDLKLDRYSGVILAGSPFTVSEPDDTKSEIERRVEADLARLLDHVIAADFPFLGICYGVGTIGAHQGATVDRTYGESVQAARIRLTTAGLNDALFAELPDEFDAFVGHKEALSQVPEHIAVLAGSASCPVQAFRVGRNVYATQFHPELDARTMSSRVRAYANHGYFAPQELDGIIEGIEKSDVRASQMVLGRFIEEYARGA